MAVRLNPKPAWRRLLDGGRLARYGSGRLPLFRARHLGGRRFQAGPINGIPLAPGEELCGRFLLFEGLRQMPPFPVPHGLIETAGGGRYSIWHRDCHFSPSAPRRGRRWPRWTIENSPRIAPLLQFVPRTIEPEPRGGLPAFLERLARRAARDGEPADARPLVAGDPVLVVTHGLPPGGAERQWCYLAQELAGRGLRVTFVVFDRLDGPEAHYLPLLRSASIPVVSLALEPMLATLQGLPRDPEDRRLAAWAGPPFGLRLPQLVAIVRRLGPRAIFAQLDHANLLSGVAGILAGVPRVALSFRNYIPDRMSYLAAEWHRSLYRSLARSPRVRLSGNARAANADYARWLGLPEEAVALIPNAVDADPPADAGPERLAALRRELGVAAGAPVILGVFRLSEEKRPDLFVETCARVAARVPGLRVLVAGVGPLEAAMRRRIAETGTGETIRLLGRREDVPALMRIASLLLLTSSLEGMPNVVLEAQVAGLPVVAAGVGGVPDCLEDGVAGHVVPPADEAAFADRCVELLLDPGRARRMGAAGTARAARAFGRAEMGERYLRLVGPAAPDGDGSRPAGVTAAAR
jgi:glycosyltransferase involved in cell wall biosynthesis